MGSFAELLEFSRPVAKIPHQGDGFLLLGVGYLALQTVAQLVSLRDANIPLSGDEGSRLLSEILIAKLLVGVPQQLESGAVSSGSRRSRGVGHLPFGFPEGLG